MPRCGPPALFVSVAKAGLNCASIQEVTNPTEAHEGRLEPNVGRMIAYASK